MDKFLDESRFKCDRVCRAHTHSTPTFDDKDDVVDDDTKNAFIPWCVTVAVMEVNIFMFKMEGARESESGWVSDKMKG